MGDLCQTVRPFIHSILQKVAAASSRYPGAQLTHPSATTYTHNSIISKNAEKNHATSTNKSLPILIARLSVPFFNKWLRLYLDLPTAGCQKSYMLLAKPRFPPLHISSQIFHMHMHHHFEHPGA
jgi:hypothetical protein